MLEVLLIILVLVALLTGNEYVPVQASYESN